MSLALSILDDLMCLAFSLQQVHKILLFSSIQRTSFSPLRSRGICVASLSEIEFSPSLRAFYKSLRSKAHQHLIQVPASVQDGRSPPRSRSLRVRLSGCASCVSHWIKSRSKYYTIDSPIIKFSSVPVDRRLFRCGPAWLFLLWRCFVDYWPVIHPSLPPLGGKHENLLLVLICLEA